MRAWIVLVVMLAGCAKPMDSDVYTSGNTVAKVVGGVVIHTRPVKIKNTSDLAGSGLGTLGGGAAGAVAGSAAGNGKGQLLTTIGGAVVGAVAGALVEDKLAEQAGTEYIVRLDGAPPKAKYTRGADGRFVSKRELKDPDAADDVNSALQTASVESNMISLVQVEATPLLVGQRVLVLYSSDRPRIVADNAGVIVDAPQAVHVNEVAPVPVPEEGLDYYQSEGRDLAPVVEEPAKSMKKTKKKTKKVAASPLVESEAVDRTDAQ